MNICSICNNSENNKIVIAREMMFGTRDEFEYLECAKCGCVQLINIPENINKYYPENYYSYQSKGEKHLIQTSFSKSLKRNLKKILLDHYLQGNSFIGKLISKKYYSYYPWLKRNTVSSRSAILDVGCGSGELLLKMYNDGFKNLTGVDPYIQEEIKYDCGITVYKKNLDELISKYDLIMLHHAFEHMDQPLNVLKNLYNLLNHKGFLIIRIPVAACFAWRKYGVNWVQLDAPRHFFLHTLKSIQLLCEQSNFIFQDVVYDSYSLQFTGSEKYLRDIPLIDESELFSVTQLKDYSNESLRLNNANDGDQACFYLYKD
ncbi:MAG: class I SAM-dependent methyltransferase [Chitinophagaceae bacterium]